MIFLSKSHLFYYKQLIEMAQDTSVFLHLVYQFPVTSALSL